MSYEYIERAGKPSGSKDKDFESCHKEDVAHVFTCHTMRLHIYVYIRTYIYLYVSLDIYTYTSLSLSLSLSLSMYVQTSGKEELSVSPFLYVCID